MQNRQLDLEQQGAALADQLPVLMAEARTLVAALQVGAHGRRRPGAGETFWQYRDYAFGDPANAIDWRQSARAPRRLFVRETEWETAATIRLWCDGEPSFDYSSGGAPTKRWRGQVLTTALALLLARAGEKISLLGTEDPARSGHSAPLRLAEALLRGTARSSLPPLPPARTTQAIYLSDFYVETSSLIDRIEAIAATGVPAHFVQLSDEAEDTFPFSGRVLFQSLSPTASARLFGDAKAVSLEYQAARRAHLDTIKATAARFGFTYMTHTTHRSAAPVMASLHRAIGDKSVR